MRGVIDTIKVSAFVSSGRQGGIIEIRDSTTVDAPLLPLSSYVAFNLSLSWAPQVEHDAAEAVDCQCLFQP